MKVAIPTADGCLTMHFGHCREFTIAEVDSAAGAITRVETLPPPPHEPGVLPRWLHEQGVELVIAGGMGRRAQSLFAQNGITVHVGAQSAPAEDVLAAYLAGDLSMGANPCDH